MQFDTHYFSFRFRKGHKTQIRLSVRSYRLHWTGSRPRGHLANHQSCVVQQVSGWPLARLHTWKGPVCCHRGSTSEGARMLSTAGFTSHFFFFNPGKRLICVSSAGQFFGRRSRAKTTRSACRRRKISPERQARLISFAVIIVTKRWRLLVLADKKSEKTDKNCVAPLKFRNREKDRF